VCVPLDKLSKRALLYYDSVFWSRVLWVVCQKQRRIRRGHSVCLNRFTILAFHTVCTVPMKSNGRDKYRDCKVMLRRAVLYPTHSYSIVNFIKFEQTSKVREMLIFSSAGSYSSGLLTGVFM